MLASKILLNGEFFEANSSRSSPASIKIGDQRASVFRGDDCISKNIKIIDIQNQKNIYLENESLFVLNDKLTKQQLEPNITKFEKIIRWLEVFSFKRALILSAILIIIIVGFRYLFHSVSSTIVQIFPIKWEQKIGDNAYKGLKLATFKPTQLSAEKIKNLTSKAQKLIQFSGLKITPEIKFHKTNFYGANAFAFPGGPIVVTDQLVKVLKSDTLILAVIAHEIAHIRQRHSLHQIIKAAGATILFSVIFGYDESLIEEASALAISLWLSKKSREFEKDADLVALDILENSGLSKKHLVESFEKLVNHFCGNVDKSDPNTCLNDIETGWFSTHPSFKERLIYLK